MKAVHYFQTTVSSLTFNLCGFATCKKDITISYMVTQDFTIKYLTIQTTHGLEFI